MASSKPTFKLPSMMVPSSSFGASGFDTEGYVYYPSGCEKKKCPIHVALHGCLQGL
jgi:poly(3-hydroxybutyrate) depolymerase